MKRAIKMGSGVSTGDATLNPQGARKNEIFYNAAGRQVGTMEDYTGVTAITPTKSAQLFAAANKYTTDNLTVNPIPANFIDPADANATAAQVEANRTFYAGNGTRKTGTMPIYTGATTVYPSSYTQTLATAGKKLNSNITVYETPPTPPPALQWKYITPQTYQQDIYPDGGYDGLSGVTVYAAPPGVAVYNITINIAGSPAYTPSQAFAGQTFILVAPYRDANIYVDASWYGIMSITGCTVIGVTMPSHDIDIYVN